ncbi:class I SAM-dependent methyltransferase [Abyssisolibacter fermentans]|uniref:class I SAM-dependent methyltransferase n=1 Tax=Abyssisolibacter fermentans TaxID=1766203 RepID=UPI00082C3B01|nr:class I SAM-dependent methyltransferase [Abyssisolibacter fermentans]
MEKVKEVLKNYSAGKLLDVGTGRGNFIHLVKNCFNSYDEIIAIDKTERAKEFFENEFQEENIKFIQMDSCNLDFENNYFDTVCLSNAIHELEDINKVLVEIKRVLKSGGLLIVNEMFCDNLSDKQMSHVLIHHFGARLDRLRGNCHNETFKKEEILDIVKGLNMEILNCFEYNTHEDQLLEDEEDDDVERITDSIGKKVKQFEDNPEYEDLEQNLREIKKYIKNNGIFGATELMIVVRKN